MNANVTSMPLLLTLWAALLPCARAQSSDSRPAPRGQLLNGVQLIVNSEVITSSDLLSLASRQSRGQIDPSQLNRLMSEGADQLARDMLMQQAGKDLGYDPKMVASMVNAELAKQKEQVGSIVALAEYFAESRKDSASFREDTEDFIYRILWRRSVTGEFIGPGGRQYVDRYVRPGQLELEFKRLGSSLDLPSKVRLQEIIIASEPGEDLAGARLRAMLVRSRAQRGEDFEALNVEYGVPWRIVDGVPTYAVDLDVIEEAKLSARVEVYEFVRGATAGDVSEPMPAVSASGAIAGFRLLRFVERIEGVAKSFQEKDFQASLRKAQVEQRENRAVEVGLAKLMAVAYIWPPEVARNPAGRRPAAPAAQPEPEAAPVGGPDPEAEVAPQPAAIDPVPELPAEDLEPAPEEPAPEAAQDSEEPDQPGRRP